jgi:hypothetical protein
VTKRPGVCIRGLHRQMMRRGCSTSLMNLSVVVGPPTPMHAGTVSAKTMSVCGEVGLSTIGHAVI